MDTVETGHKYCDMTKNILFERCRAFWNGFVHEFYRLKVLTTLEQVNTSVVKKKKNLYEQKFSKTKMVRLAGQVL